jgi:cell division protein FtsW
MEATRERESYDWGLLVVTLILLILGAGIILDASFARAMQSAGSKYDAFYFFKRQVMWAGPAMIAMMAAMRFPYWKLRESKFWLLGVIAAGVLLLLVMVVGREINGSKRWFSIGPFGFQPSEFAKVALIIFLARYSELWRTRIQDLWKGFIPPVLVVLALGGLIAKEDLGTAITTIGTGLLMIGMMGARPKHMLGLVALAVLVGVGFIFHEPYRLQRIYAWVDLVVRPVAKHDGVAYQPAQGLLALGSGGLWGKGIMLGSAKHLYLPAEHTDYILATVGEETGLVGCLTLLSLFGWLIIRGLTIAHRTRDWFGSLLAAGLTTMIGLQALLNIAVVTSLVPCTGVPLPFISYGGSSLVFTTLAVGIILNISQYPSQGDPGKVKENRESRADGWRNGRPHLSRT